MSKTQVPGVVIHHVPASTQQYVGCPSLAILDDGRYIASHSYFGPKSANNESFIYESVDRGESWTRIAELQGQMWSNLFVHRGALYIMGTDYCDIYGSWTPGFEDNTDLPLNGRMVIRRSTDGGRTWTTPDSSKTGLLSDHDGFHTAPVPVILHAGRLWRSMEYSPHIERLFWRTFMLSIPEDADLLDRSNWVMSEMMEHTWSNTQWIEGNAVVDRDGTVANILLTRYRGALRERAVAHIDRAAMVHVSRDGRYLVHHPDYDMISFPGGGVKFTIRLDPVSNKYWALVNRQLDPTAWRNRLVLISSDDLRRWTQERVILSHPDTERHGFQYADWRADGDDMVFVLRTAFDDDEGGANNYHDANYLTFHRIRNFRSQSE